jgi:hypothetical protein
MLRNTAITHRLATSGYLRIILGIGEGAVQRADADVSWGSHLWSFCSARQHLVSNRIIHTVVSVLHVLRCEFAVFLVRRLLVPVRALGTAGAFAFEKKGADFRQVAAVVWITSCKSRELIADCSSCIGSSRSIYCLLLSRKKLAIDSGSWDHCSGSVLGEELITNLQRKTILQIKKASLTAVFDFAAALTHLGLLVSSLGSWFPSEDAKRTRTNLALRAQCILSHADVRIIAQAYLELVKR